jgi:hypothetical protein
MKPVDEGPHQLAKLKTLASVVVTPLGEQYRGHCVRFRLKGDKDLLVSQRDADKINWLVSDNPTGKVMTMTSEGNKIRLRMSE